MENKIAGPVTFGGTASRAITCLSYVSDANGRTLCTVSGLNARESEDKTLAIIAAINCDEWKEERLPVTEESVPPTRQNRLIEACAAAMALSVVFAAGAFLWSWLR